jgi:hypothetical protein
MQWEEICYHRLSITEKWTDKLNQEEICFCFILNFEQAKSSLHLRLVGVVIKRKAVYSILDFSFKYTFLKTTYKTNICQFAYNWEYLVGFSDEFQCFMLVGYIQIHFC